MGPKKKKSDRTQELKDVVNKLKEGLSAERHLVIKGTGWSRHLAASLDESLRILEDVAEDLRVWDSTQLAEESLRVFSRLELSASLYLLRRYYYELKDDEEGELLTKVTFFRP